MSWRVARIVFIGVVGIGLVLSVLGSCELLGEELAADDAATTDSGDGSDGGSDDGSADDGGATVATFGELLTCATGNTYATDLAMDADRIVVGGATMTDGDPPQTLGWVATLNMDGTIAWQKQIDYDDPFSSGLVPRAVAITPDGGVLAAGSPAQDVVTLTRFDTSGALLWDRSFEGYVDDASFDLMYVHELQIRDDNSILMVAETAGNNTLLAQFSSDGTPEWSAVVGAVHHRVAVTDEGYLLLGMRTYRGSTVPNVFSLVSADASGVPTGSGGTIEEYLSTKSELTQQHDIVDSAIGPDGSVYAIGTTLQFTPDHQSVMVTKRSGDGSIIWRMEYRPSIGDETFSEGTGITVDADGTVRIAGRIGSSGYSYLQDAFTLQLDSDGTVLGGAFFPEQFDSFQVTADWLDIDMPAIAGSPETGWAITGIQGRSAGAAGDFELFLTDAAGLAGGAGTPITPDQVTAVNQTDAAYDTADDDEFVELHLIAETRTAEDPTSVTDATLTVQ